LNCRDQIEQGIASILKFISQGGTPFTGGLPGEKISRVALGADHGGFELKQFLKEHLEKRGLKVQDFGTNSASSTDYPDYAQAAAEYVAAGKADAGLLVCTTGIGMSIAANKVPRIRAAVVHNFESATKSREHNDANVLCLGSWVCSEEDNLHIVDLWTNEKFGELRHVRRIERIAPEPNGKIVFANGIFDILHQGHVQLLAWARNLGDRLVVGINSDASTKALKGETRPINSSEDRKAVLQALRYVDEVLIFDELRPTNLIKALMPAIVVKGGEYLADEIRGRDDIPPGIEIKVYPMMKGYSSTNVIQKIRNN